MVDEPATVTHAREVLASLSRRDLRRLLESDARVREWLADGVLLSAADAAAFVDVERSRLWRWERAGKNIAPVAHTSATPLYFRPDLERLKREVAEAARKKEKAAA